MWTNSLIMHVYIIYSYLHIIFIKPVQHINECSMTQHTQAYDAFDVKWLYSRKYEIKVWNMKKWN